MMKENITISPSPWHRFYVISIEVEKVFLQIGVVICFCFDSLT